jgi:drug/metabolite transporter (DMT)-like permease
MKIQIAAIGTMVVLSFGQILLKLLAGYVGTVQGRLLEQAVIFRIIGYLGALALTYGVVFLLWIYVLRTVELNRAFLYAALTFVFVPLLSYMILGENIRPATVVGAALIVCGIIVSGVF